MTKPHEPPVECNPDNVPERSYPCSRSASHLPSAIRRRSLRRRRSKDATMLRHGTLHHKVPPEHGFYDKAPRALIQSFRCHRGDRPSITQRPLREAHRRRPQCRPYHLTRTFHGGFLIDRSKRPRLGDPAPRQAQQFLSYQPPQHDLLSVRHWQYNLMLRHGYSSIVIAS